MFLVSNILSELMFTIIIDSIILSLIFQSQQGSGVILLFTNLMYFIPLSPRTILAKVLTDISDDLIVTEWVSCGLL